MATEIKIPTLGESISEGVVSAWLKDEGEWVDRDEPILELETDKITMEVPAPAAGALSRTVGEGDTVSVGQVVGAIDESAEKQAGASEKKQDAAPAEGRAQKQQGGKDAGGAKSSGSAVKEPPSQPAREPAAGAPGEGRAAQDDADVAATPLARKLAEEHRVRLGSISGTGAGGRVREQDVLAYIQTHQNGQGSPAPASLGAAPTPASSSRGTRVERMTPLRQRIAARLVEAQQTAAMLTTFNECDMSAVMALRSAHKEAFEKAHGVKLGFMSFFVKSAASALQKFPRVNAYIVDDGGAPALEHHDYCDIAIAVGTKKGLVVPVLRNCETRSFAQIESGIGDLAETARDGKLTLEDMPGGTFTISNGGVYGSMLSTPILNPPQSGILGMHNIIRRPVENPDKPGSGEMVVRPMMYLALSYDHRMVDGAEAVGFLKHIKECIESPDRLLIGV
ncbi:MAG: 2-oxoglutarate dehydrogenase complex dihydrolipoyllysine-residue succinyltransferase [Phycisphaerales bacterium]